MISKPSCASQPVWLHRLSLKTVFRPRCGNMKMSRVTWPRPPPHVTLSCQNRQRRWSGWKHICVPISSWKVESRHTGVLVTLRRAADVWRGLYGKTRPAAPAPAPGRRDKTGTKNEILSWDWNDDIRSLIWMYKCQARRRGKRLCRTRTHTHQRAHTHTHTERQKWPLCSKNTHKRNNDCVKTAYISTQLITSFTKTELIWWNTINATDISRF